MTLNTARKIEWAFNAATAIITASANIENCGV